MKNNFQKIPIILSTLIFICLCFAFVFLYKETNSNNQKAGQNMATLQAEVDRLDGITLLDHTLAQNSDNLAMLETHFARSSNVVPFLDSIQQLGPEAGAEVVIDSVGAGANNTGLIVELKASGSFASVYKFLTLLENSPYELNFLSTDIHRLADLNNSSKSAPNPGWEAIFKIRLLSFVQ